MGIKVEGPSYLNATELRVRKIRGTTGAIWLEVFVVGHDGQEVEVASVFDTHAVTVEAAIPAAERA